MTIRDQESKQVMAAAMRYIKNGDRTVIEGYSLPVLRNADYQLSDRDMDSGYRNVIKDRIRELENENNKADVIEIKPNIGGLGLNLNEAFRRLKAWFRRS